MGDFTTRERLIYAAFITVKVTVYRDKVEPFNDFFGKIRL
uniref:Uncharacterized protein n=1 Tax=Myoviridae sp. ctoIO8 TaxID=2825173 RepID=A0A8S5P3W3_9CAUD|nr:MAG TPA: hypothetical protein [Myoviridae sp. ctoIO8]